MSIGQRSDIAFSSHGMTCRGWLYQPTASGRAPAIVMSHGFSAVKEQGLAEFAGVFCDAGLAVLVFDHRYLGDSDGDERGRIIASEQHEDTRAALTWLSRQPGIDADRIGLWGTSYSGGHALFIGALDPRVKAVVAQAPALDVARSLIGLAGRAGFDGYLALLADDQAKRNRGEPSGRIPVVAPTGEPSVLATADSYDWFSNAARTTLTWTPTTTLESVARMAEYQPASFVDLISPKPLLMIAAENDSLIPIAQVRSAFARAGEPKKLIEVRCGHFDFYPGQPHHELAARAATDWFRTHLLS
ncbi:MAG: alpha/beta hydrolase [Pseudomonadota bacterium]